MNQYRIIVEAMEKAGYPLSDMQEVLLAGSFSVLIESAVVAEREACAKVCDELSKLWPDEGGTPDSCASDIRSRGNK